MVLQQQSFYSHMCFVLCSSSSLQVRGAEDPGCRERRGTAGESKHRNM